MSNQKTLASKLQPTLIVCTLMTTISTLMVVSWASYSSYNLLQTLAADYTPQIDAALNHIEAAGNNSRAMVNMLVELQSRINPVLNALENTSG